MIEMTVPKERLLINKMKISDEMMLVNFKREMYARKRRKKGNSE